MSSSLRARQREHIRQSIDAAAVSLFLDRGYSNVTTDEIASAAGVSPSTYYRHVATKEDLLLRPVRASSAAIVERYRAITTGAPAEDLIRAIRAQTESVDDTELRQWRQVIAQVPAILHRLTLISDTDRESLIEITAERLSLTVAEDLRPGVLVAEVLAVVEYGYQRWMTTDTDTPLLTLIDAALAAARFASP